MRPCYFRPPCLRPMSARQAVRISDGLGGEGVGSWADISSRSSHHLPPSGGCRRRGTFRHTLSLLGPWYIYIVAINIVLLRSSAGVLGRRPSGYSSCVCLDHAGAVWRHQLVSRRAQGQAGSSGGGVSDNKPQASRIVGPERWCFSP